MLFTGTPICCTWCLDEQHGISHVPLKFVPKVAFSSLNVLFIFLQWSKEPFLHCDVLFTCNEFIFSKEKADPNMVTRGEGTRRWLINVAFAINFIIFCHQIQDECDKIMFIISMNRRNNNINFIFITLSKSKIHACNSYKLDTLLLPFILKQPYNVAIQQHKVQLFI